MDIVIVGGGPAGLAAAKWSRKFWPTKSVTLIEEGKAIGCCRPLLPQFLADQVKEEKIYQAKVEDDPWLKILIGQRAVGLDQKRQCLYLENGEGISYERLLLAPGGKPICPNWEEINKCQGIFAIRNFPEAQKAREWLKAGQQISILGGGLVGVKTAVYLQLAGFAVSLIEKEKHILPQALTDQAAKYIEDYLRQLGIKIFLGETLTGMKTEQGQIKKVSLSKREIPCDTLLLAIGSEPNISFLKDTSLVEEDKLVAFPTLQTKDPRIFAAGDAVTLLHPEGRKLSLWTWPQAVIQGKLAAANFYLTNPLSLRILSKANSLNIAGVPLNVIEGSKEYTQEIFYSPVQEKIFRQLFLKGRKLTGGVLWGNITKAGVIQHIVSNEREDLLEKLELVKPGYYLMPSSLFAQRWKRREARFIMAEEKEEC